MKTKKVNNYEKLGIETNGDLKTTVSVVVLTLAFLALCS